MKTYSIAIDGPAASGKSTAAKGVAKALDFLYLDTGAMYRAITLYMIEKGLDTRSEEDAKSILDEVTMREDKNGHIFLNERDVTERVREEDVTKLVSYACAHKAVRKRLVALQREMAKGESVVMDGRDIGTVVFPDAELKFFITASPEVRAQRRMAELQAKGESASYEEVLSNIRKRDYLDTHREVGPLRQADDARVLDNSNMTIPEQKAWLLAQFHEVVDEEA